MTNKRWANGATARTSTTIRFFAHFDRTGTRDRTLRNAYNVDANHWKREQHQLHQRARNGPAYDYQILSAWGCAFTRVGGWKREGCWATARPAAPPPAPSRDSRKIQLSLSPSRAKPHPLVSSPSLLPPCSRGAIRRFTPAILPTNTTSVLFFVIPVLLSFFSSFLELLFILYRALLSHSLFPMSSVCAPCLELLHRSFFRLMPLTRHNASGDFCARHGWVGYSRMNALVRLRPAIAWWCL